MKNTKKRLVCILSILVLVLTLFSGTFAFAQSDGAPEAISMVIYDDAYSSRGFSWLTDKTVSDGSVEYVEASGKIDDVDWSSASVATGTKKSLNDDYNTYKATVKGLTEGKKYYYRVGSKTKNIFSSVATITMPSKDNSMSFLWITDPQETSKAGYQDVNKVLELGLATNPKAEFILCTGDNVNSSYQSTPNYNEWKYLFSETKNITRNYPLMTVAGNHETINGVFTERFNYDYQGDENDLVNGGFYSFDYGDAHIAMINTNEAERTSVFEKSQLPWLKRDLASTDKKWKIVGTHRNAMSVGTYFEAGETLYIKEKLLPIMSQYNVDFVFQGHNHVYSRTNPYKFNTPTGSVPNTDLEYFTQSFMGSERNFTSEPDGTTYMMINYSGNKQYEVANTDPNRISIAKNPIKDGICAAAPHMPMFASVTIQGNRLAIDSYVVDRQKNSVELFDTYSIAKNTNLEVEALIQALPSVYDVYYTDARAIKNAKDAFDNLTPSAKAKISQLSTTKLNDVMAQIGDLNGAIAVLDVQDSIKNLPETSLEDSFLQLLTQAEQGYNNLSVSQKPLVNNASKLSECRADLCDMLKADEVVKIIQELDDNFSQEKVALARAAYNKLSAKQRAYVTNIDKLKALENAPQPKKGCNSMAYTPYQAAVCMLFLLLIFSFTIVRKKQR